MRRLRKILKILALIVFVLLIGVFIAAQLLLKPRSDHQILNKLKNNHSQPFVTKNNFNGLSYRVVAMQQQIDTTLPTLVFLHGSPGSPLDFARYFKDSSLNKKANIISYERIGYGLFNAGEVQGSVAAELDILHDFIKEIPPEKIVLVGYSYGGTIIMASPKNYKYKVSLASAVSAELEPMFWTLNLYKWQFTRPLIPKVVQAAAKEKFSHLTDLTNYDSRWVVSKAPVLNIHGDKDWIVPYENSVILENKFRNKPFKMVTIPNGGHELIWSDFELIKNEIVTTLD